MSMNFNPKPDSKPEPKKNNTRLIIGLVIMAILIIFVTIGAIYLGNGMNHVASQFSSVKEPVSVLQTLTNP